MCEIDGLRLIIACIRLLHVSTTEVLLKQLQLNAALLLVIILWPFCVETPHVRVQISVEMDAIRSLMGLREVQGVVGWLGPCEKVVIIVV